MRSDIRAPDRQKVIFMSDFLNYTVYVKIYKVRNGLVAESLERLASSEHSFHFIPVHKSCDKIAVHSPKQPQVEFIEYFNTCWRGDRF